MRVLLLSLLCGVLSVPVAPALAQTTPEQCAAIAGDGERLSCYDAIFRTGGDLPNEVLIESERLIPALPAGRAPATMTVACLEGVARVSFGFAGQLVSSTGDIAPVTFQVDQNATSVRTLAPVDSNTALNFAPGRETEAFLDSLIAGTSLKVRMTPLRQRSLTVDFRLPDHAEAIAALRAACR